MTGQIAFFFFSRVLVVEILEPVRIVIVPTVIYQPGAAGAEWAGLLNALAAAAEPVAGHHDRASA